MLKDGSDYMKIDPKVEAFARSKGFIHIQSTFTNSFMTPFFMVLFAASGLFGAILMKLTTLDIWLSLLLVMITFVLVQFKYREKIRIISYDRMKQNYLDELNKLNANKGIEELSVDVKVIKKE